MVKQIFVCVLAVVSSLNMLMMFGGIFDGGAVPLLLVLSSIGTSLAMSAILAWPKGETIDDPLQLMMFPFLMGWRACGKTLVGMGAQALTVLIYVAYVDRDVIGTLYVVYMAAIAVPTAFLLAAVLFAPKEKTAQKQEPSARQTAST